MWRRVIPASLLVVYSALLTEVLVFKDIPVIRIGHMMFNFGGTNANGEANFVPFKTIASYVLGHEGFLIGSLNIVGNIVLLIPIGFIAPFVYQKMTWRTSLVLAVASGLAIELLQVVLHVGIFDIDDVLLNALGVILGYGVFKVFVRK